MSGKKAILTNDAPQPIGPYSQAIQSGGYLFCSGQIAIDPATGQVEAGDIKVQTRRVMTNIQAVLTKAGKNFGDVVKTTIFLKSMGDFPVVNEIYGSYFVGLTPPARSTVEVSALPKGVMVEIEVIAAG